MVVVITGATAGIGLATARLLATQGQKVYGLARRPINEPGITFLPCDITATEQVSAVLAQINAQAGRIDVLINNAGIGLSGAFEHHSVDDIDQLLAVNLRGLLLTTQTALPYLRQTHGRIINLGSVAGELVVPFQTLYSASKSMISAFSAGLANELKPFGVQVTSVLPGDTKTDFTRNRKKNTSDGSYQARVERSVAKMEHDEMHGVSPLKVAKVIARVLKKKRAPLQVIVGADYRFLVFLKRFLPKRWVQSILYSMYGK